MNLFTEVINELRQYSTCQILEVSPLLKAAEINIQYDVFTLYTKGSDLWIGLYNQVGDVVNYRLNGKTADAIVDELYDRFG